MLVQDFKAMRREKRPTANWPKSRIFESNPRKNFWRSQTILSEIVLIGSFSNTSNNGTKKRKGKRKGLMGSHTRGKKVVGDYPLKEGVVCQLWSELVTHS